MYQFALIMNKHPWAKYLFSIWLVALVAAVIAKFVTNSLYVLVPLSIGLYWFFVKSLARINGYR